MSIKAGKPEDEATLQYTSVFTPTLYKECQMVASNRSVMLRSPLDRDLAHWWGVGAGSL